MGGFDKSTLRVIAVVALLVLAAWALRGYVPGAERTAEREQPTDSPVAFAAVITMVTVAVAIIGYAIIARMRDRRPGRAPAGALPRSPGGVGRPTWRFSLIALAAIIAWVLLVSLLGRIVGPGPVERTDPAPPAASESATPPADRERPPADTADPEPDDNIIGYLVPPMLVLMVLVVVGTAVASRRQRRSAPQDWVTGDFEDPPAAPAAADSLARAAEVGLAAIEDLSREPREAIIACYAAMERELTRVPGAVPQAFDTPSEVLARAVEHRALRADSATELVELFEEARFSPHVMTESHRDAAVQVLQRVLDELPHGSVA